MFLTKISSTGFRTLAEICFEPSTGVNIIRGDNAQGKTSILEAILFAATARSHRTNVESELAKHGESWFQIRLQAKRKDRDVAIEANWWKGVKRFKVNGVLQQRISDILGKVNVVLFSPEDLVLVKGSGANRRRFLDMELSQISPNYLGALQQYRQALKQRNELLRGHNPDPDMLDPWDAQLAKYGVVLMRERGAFIAELAERASEAYARIAEGEKFRVTYAADAPEDELAAVIKKSRLSDIKRGTTTRGPHRDDMSTEIEGQPARSFGSQGQQKTAALSLRLAELNLVKERTGEYPILLLDEVLSELDEKRSRFLFDSLDDGVQCIITATTLVKHSGLIRCENAVYHIEKGALEKKQA
jgi:DNA replication and repair protein RecF